MEKIRTTTECNITINDVTISYNDYGTGIMPIIFLHGFPFDKTSWQPQMESLKNTHRVIAYDIRGFGKSTTGKSSPSIRLFADDLIQFMDGLSINKAVVCGLSMGGYILLNAISRYPNRFEAIVLCDTQCIADSDETKEKRNETIVQIKANGLKSFAQGFIKNIFCQESLDTKKELVERINKIILSTPFNSVVETLGALTQRENMCSTLNKISVPTLILCGKEDVVTVPEESEFLQDNIENSTLYIIDNAGHLSNLEQSGEFNQHLANFISEI